MVKLGRKLQMTLTPIEPDKPAIMRMMMLVRTIKRELGTIQVMIHPCNEQLTQDTLSAIVQVVFVVLGT